MQSAMPLTAPDSIARSAATAPMRILATEDEALLKVDLSGLELPRVDNLHVDGLQRSWWSRLFGK